MASRPLYLINTDNWVKTVTIKWTLLLLLGIKIQWLLMDTIMIQFTATALGTISPLVIAQGRVHIGKGV